MDNLKKFDLSRLSGNSIFNPELIDYEDSIDIIGDEIHSVRKSFVKIGWHLKHIKEKETYRRDGYEDIFEFAHAKFKMSDGTVNRMINLCINFSVGHDSPELDERYQGFDESQLFEMLPMKESERDEISPDMTVKQIREKKAENKAMKEPSKELVGSFLKAEGINSTEYETISDLKEYLINMYGKTHSVGSYPCIFVEKIDKKGITHRCGSYLCNYKCTPRGISLDKYDEITWLAFAKKAWRAGANSDNPPTAESVEISKTQDAEDKLETVIADDQSEKIVMNEEYIKSMDSGKEGVVSGKQDCDALMEEAHNLSEKLCKGLRFSTQNHTLSQVNEYQGWSERLNNIINVLCELYK